jgi:spectinomycin phosphotransferase
LLKKPELNDEVIRNHLESAYGLQVENISFLPLGADLNTSVYRVTAKNKNDYFLKLRLNNFNEASVKVPKYLAEIGLKKVIASITTITGKTWESLENYKAILYPYIEGSNAIEKPLSNQQWIEFGEIIKSLHSVNIPKTITNGTPQETFTPKWRDQVKAFLHSINTDSFTESVAAEMAIFLKSKSDEILKIVERTENLAQLLKTQKLEYILCHADIHGWNLLIDKNNALYLIDWDTLIFAPKERDLMFIGAGIWNSGFTEIEEEKLFYKGYGQTAINKDAICYYRYERIIQDIAEYCTQIFLSDDGLENKQQSFKYLKANFLPNNTIEMAYQTDKKQLTNF